VTGADQRPNLRRLFAVVLAPRFAFTCLFSLASDRSLSLVGSADRASKRRKSARSLGLQCSARIRDVLPEITSLSQRILLLPFVLRPFVSPARLLSPSVPSRPSFLIPLSSFSSLERSSRAFPPPRAFRPPRISLSLSLLHAPARARARASPVRYGKPLGDIFSRGDRRGKRKPIFHGDRSLLGRALQVLSRSPRGSIPSAGEKGCDAGDSETGENS